MTPTRRQFLRTQTSVMRACDFFHVDYAVTLRRVYVFFDHTSYCGVLASAAAKPTALQTSTALP